MEQKPFFDMKAVMAIFLMGVVLFGWQKYLAWKYPHQISKSKTSASNRVSVEDKNISANNNVSLNEQKEKEAFRSDEFLDSSFLNQLEAIPLITQQWDASIHPLGFGLSDFKDKFFKDKKGQAATYLEQGHVLQIFDPSTNNPIRFTIEKKGEHLWTGEAQWRGGNILREITVENDGSINIKTIAQVTEETPEFKFIWSAMLPTKSSGFLNPSGDHLELASSEDGSSFHIQKIDEKTTVDIPLAKVMALSSHYFTNLVLENSNILPKLKGYVKNGRFYLEMLYPIPQPRPSTIEFIQKFFAGPKKAEQLQALDPRLVGVIDFGFFATIGNGLLKLLKIFYSWVGNWGWAIILLTLFVRFIVLPFNVMAYRSMQKMQKIQPKLQELREKLKNDPVAMNRETMDLMKREKVNPLGGCLPMLLQMPVFFALYQVLSHAIELYQAPFIGWIHDLSSKDPYYILPILMGVVLFIQHKMTPSTLDPAQAKIMAFMPIIFTLFTLGLPAGLTLYITVSTFFGVIQQHLFMKHMRVA